MRQTQRFLLSVFASIAAFAAYTSSCSRKVSPTCDGNSCAYVRRTWSSARWVPLFFGVLPEIYNGVAQYPVSCSFLRKMEHRSW